MGALVLYLILDNESCLLCGINFQTGLIPWFGRSSPAFRGDQETVRHLRFGIYFGIDLAFQEGRDISLLWALDLDHYCCLYPGI